MSEKTRLHVYVIISIFFLVWFSSLRMHFNLIWCLDFFDQWTYTFSYDNLPSFSLHLVFLNIILRIFRSQDVVTIVYNNTDDREKIQVTHIYQEPGLSVWRNFPKITHQWYRNKLKLTLVLCETYAVNYLFHERKKYVKLLTVACLESPILPNVPRLLQIRPFIA